MLNVSIIGQDNLYRNGLRELITQIIEVDMQRSVTFFDDDRPEAVSQLDIIVIIFGTGESCLCHPALIHRKAGSLVIGFDKNDNEEKREVLPFCFSDIVFLRHAESPDVTRKKIIKILRGSREDNPLPAKDCCKYCFNNTISVSQYKIVEQICNGGTHNQIASRLGISYKTISAYKRNIMTKFSLSNDYDLVVFFKRIKNLQQTLITPPVE